MKQEHFITICRHLIDNPETTQRELAAYAKISLGTINSTLKESIAAGYLQQEPPRKMTLTQAGQTILDKYKVKNAIILAAGFGSRCIPLTYETPKGLLEVYGKPMIERQIEQLHEKRITDITVIVGYKKERFDYLVDKYGVKLVYNPEHGTKNNLASLYHALARIDSTYILSSDFWIEENIFNTYETRNWYSCVFFDGNTHEWCVATTQTDKIESISIGGHDSFAIVGPAYITSASAKELKKYVSEYYNNPGTEDYYWEQILKDHPTKIPMYMNRQTGNVYEIENFDELRMFDPSYNAAEKNKILQLISNVFKTQEEEIQEIQPVKEGMTNRSFTFIYNNKKYIMRIPGEGTDRLIDRKNEYETYQVIAPLGICDDLLYIDPDEGYKISGYIDNARVCDPNNMHEVRMCMKKLKDLHELNLKVDHTFDIFGQIEFYECLLDGKESYFSDYQDTKAKVMSLKEYIDSIDKSCTLTHIDAVPDNFLFYQTDEGEEIRLIDWEYAGMQDPHVDIAMFAIYSQYDQPQIDALIDCYFENTCDDETRNKIYAYISMCGLLWSNWCEYKSLLGVEFGEYALRQYRYAKDYYAISKKGHQ